MQVPHDVPVGVVTVLVPMVDRRAVTQEAHDRVDHAPFRGDAQGRSTKVTRGSIHMLRRSRAHEGLDGLRLPAHRCVEQRGPGLDIIEATEVGAVAQEDRHRLQMPVPRRIGQQV